MVKKKANDSKDKLDLSYLLLTIVSVSGVTFFTFASGFGIIFLQLWIKPDLEPILVLMLSFLGAYLGGRLYEFFFIRYLYPFILKYFCGGDAT